MKSDFSYMLAYGLAISGVLCIALHFVIKYW